MRLEFIDRFWLRVDVGDKGDDDCWEWNGARYPNGYGAFYSGTAGRRSLAHRWIAQEGLGRILDTRDIVGHHCDNPPCVNPSHLFVGTQLDNMRDCKLKGRIRGGSVKGSRPPRNPASHCRRGHVLTPENIYRHADAFRGFRIKCRTCLKAAKDGFRHRQQAA